MQRARSLQQRALKANCSLLNATFAQTLLPLFVSNMHVKHLIKNICLFDFIKK